MLKLLKGTKEWGETLTVSTWPLVWVNKRELQCWEVRFKWIEADRTSSSNKDQDLRPEDLCHQQIDIILLRRATQSTFRQPVAWTREQIKLMTLILIAIKLSIKTRLKLQEVKFLRLAPFSRSRADSAQRVKVFQDLSSNQSWVRDLVWILFHLGWKTLRRRIL